MIEPLTVLMRYIILFIIIDRYLATLILFILSHENRTLPYRNTLYSNLNQL